MECYSSTLKQLLKKPNNMEILMSTYFSVFIEIIWIKSPTFSNWLRSFKLNLISNFSSISVIKIIWVKESQLSTSLADKSSVNSILSSSKIFWKISLSLILSSFLLSSNYKILDNKKIILPAEKKVWDNWLDSKFPVNASL